MNACWSPSVEHMIALTAVGANRAYAYLVVRFSLDRIHERRDRYDEDLECFATRSLGTGAS